MTCNQVTGSASFKTITQKSLRCLVLWCGCQFDQQGSDREQAWNAAMQAVSLHGCFLHNGTDPVGRRGHDHLSQLQPVQAYLERTVKIDPAHLLHHTVQQQQPKGPDGRGDSAGDPRSLYLIVQGHPEAHLANIWKARQRLSGADPFKLDAERSRAPPPRRVLVS